MYERLYWGERLAGRAEVQLMMLREQAIMEKDKHAPFRAITGSGKFYM